jgi:hypothetical protein
MQITEFFYWLQGYFEISIVPKVLTIEQCVIIRRHVALVFASKNKCSPDDTMRIAKMDTLLSLAIDGDISSENVTDRIRNEVHAQFVHVIDPGYGPNDVQEKLNIVHNGSHSLNDKPLMKC